MAWASLTISFAGFGATLPLYVNNGSVTNPQVDATAFLNAGTFTTLPVTFPSLPYDTANTLFYTNDFNALMTGSDGFRLQFITNAVRLPAANVLNRGTITGNTHLLIIATNVTNSGLMNVGSQGLIRIDGGSVNLARSGLEAGGSASPPINDGFKFTPYYVNPTGVDDLYWGGGDNNRLGNNGRPMFLNTFTLPFPFSPLHEVMFAGSPFTNLVQVPFFNFGRPYEAHVFTSVSGGEPTIQVVFVPISTDTNLITTVRFDNFFSGNGAATAIIEFAAPDVDITTGQPLTNYVYFLDSLAVLGTNGTFLDTNILSFSQNIQKFRPDAYEVTRSTPFEWFFAQPENTPFDPTLIDNPLYDTNRVDMSYAAYSARISGGGTFSFAQFTESTNYPGSVQLNADRLDLTQTRIRSENLLSIRATNLIGNSNSIFDAPLINYQLITTNPVLTVDSLVGNTVTRLSGSLAAWSGIWTNSLASGGPTINFHVLIVDHTFTTTQPVTVGNLLFRSTNVVIGDNINAQLSFVVDATTLTVNTNGSIGLASAIGNLNAVNLPRLKSLTNNGVIAIGNAVNFGADTPQPYSNFVNRGSISANTVLIRAASFENGGSLQSVGGPIQVGMTSGLITNGSLTSLANLELSARDLTISNSTFRAGGALLLTVTNSLSDGGFTNDWQAGNGFQLPLKPAAGDLLGTRLTSTAAIFRAVSHLWAGENRSVSNDGYSNNTALGRLILDGAFSTLFTFSGVSVTNTNGLYVDFLELRGNATNFSTALQIDPNLIVYFADASLPVDKLNGALGGRLRWVSTFAGPNSSVLVTNSVTSQTFLVNRALRNSTTIDSDADGVVNALDAYPFDPVAVSLVVEPMPSLGSPAPSAAFLSWPAAANTTYRIECKKTLNGPWQFVANYTHGPKVGIATVMDPVSTNAGCFYRVIYFP